MTTRITITPNTGSATVDALIGAAILAIMISIPLAWFTHIIWIIKALASDKGATMGQMVLGGLGAFMPPVGVIHGYMIWFGVGA